MTEEINNPVNEEEKDVEVMEFELNEEEIDELITKLQLLKETKEQINFDIDDENSFLINYIEEEN
tara:strand:- start:69 stop:263 length:195 start_codon:yes stop_codon:yes gene_type:complete